MEKPVCTDCGYGFIPWKCDDCDTYPDQCIDCHGCINRDLENKTPKRVVPGMIDKVNIDYHGGMFHRGEW